MVDRCLQYATELSLSMATASRALDFAVSFEFDDRPPLTHRGTVAASRGDTLVSRAMRDATKALHPVRWSSAVVVLTRVSSARSTRT
jgi:hypothetical protein